jgi:hypothetical protein
MWEYLLFFLLAGLGIILLGWYAQQTGAGYGIAQLGYGVGEVGKGIQTFVSSVLSPQITPKFVPEIGIKLNLPNPFATQPNSANPFSAPSGVVGGYNHAQGVDESTPKQTQPKYVFL